MKKNTNNQHRRNYRYGLYAAVLVVLAYGLASWAIDSGRILAYALTCASTYAAVRYIILMIQKK